MVRWRPFKALFRRYFFVVVIIKSIIKAHIKGSDGASFNNKVNAIFFVITIILWVCVWYYYCGEQSPLTWHADQPTPTNITSGRILSPVLIKMKREKNEKMSSLWMNVVAYSRAFINGTIRSMISRWGLRGGCF